MSYKIELIPSGISGARNTMYRSGLKFEVGQAQILDLTDEELEVFENDWRFKVSDSKDPGAKIAGGATSAGQTISPTDKPFAKPIADFEVETVENSNAAPAQEASSNDETTLYVEELLKENSRDELDALARELGIEDPESLANKTEVAQAIVGKQ